MFAGRRAGLIWFAATVLVSAFLVFQVQPVVSKAVLPWFGGSPAVWTTCMLFFQTLLFAGYAYAHCITRWFSPRWQGGIHLALMVAALLVLPVVPDESWKPTGGENPTGSILLLLLANVGLPYFILSATGPLVQAWFREMTAGRSPYRLYALSNAGSLAALVSYPFIVEPAFSTGSQSRLWSLGFALFVLLCGCLTAGLWGIRRTEDAVPQPGALRDPRATRPDWRAKAAWLLFPAFASIMLLATTNHVCQDVAVVPFLWVAPLSLYLITFIICFDREHWYSRRWCGVGAVLSLIGVTLLVYFDYKGAVPLEVAAYFAAMFFVCMLCHGELVRNRPDPRYLTAFYLLVSGGGALGGLVVAVLCPLLFSSHLEMKLGVLVGTALAAGLLIWDARETWLGDTPPRRVIAALGYFAVFFFVGVVQFDAQRGNVLASVRNFYGVLRVEGGGESPGTALIHGRVIHGFQFSGPRRRAFPTTYYAPDSGVGLTLQRLGESRSLRVGAVGLGCGTVAAYGRPGDSYRFYEINPAVVDIARDYFTYLSDCRAEVSVALGDARLSMEREASQAWDVLILDAFSGDAVPTHLLTREAFEVYLRHLQPEGVLAVHISNRHLDLAPIVRRLAAEFELQCLPIRNRGDKRTTSLPATWILVTRNDGFLSDPEIAAAAGCFGTPTAGDAPLWTDQHSNLFEILRVY